MLFLKNRTKSKVKKSIVPRDFDEKIHFLRGKKLSELDLKPGVALHVGCSGNWYFEWIDEQVNAKFHSVIGLEKYSPKPMELPESTTWISSCAGYFEGVANSSVDWIYSGQNLEHLWEKDFVKAIIVVTTDKVYKNDNSGMAFVETNPLEGKDPYSASKVETEAVVTAWQQIAKVTGGPKIVSVRAGNIITGGDFADNRILPDLVRGIITGNPVVIRNPESTRPWQHVLDPLWGYLLTLEESLDSKRIVNVNFSPKGESLSVADVVEIVKTTWSEIKIEVPHSNTMNSNRSQMESKELHLDSSLANNLLGWKPIFTQQESIISTVNWWKNYLSSEFNAQQLCAIDIAIFSKSNSYYLDQNYAE